MNKGRAILLSTSVRPLHKNLSSCLQIMSGIMFYLTVANLQNRLSGGPMSIRMYFTLSAFFAFLMVCLKLGLNYSVPAILIKQENLSKKRESCFHGLRSSILLGSFMPV